jgi:hypothetical protein
MSPMRNTGFRSFFLALVISVLTIGIAAAQHKDEPSAPHPSAPHVSAPHPAPSRPANRPSNTSRPSNTGARTGMNGNSRNTGSRSNSGTTGRGGNRNTGNSSMNRNAGNKNTPMGRNANIGGKSASLNRPNARPLPGRQVSLRGGGTASFRPNGQIRSINRNGMHINRGLNGTRHIESMHNGARIVSTGRGRGYVQRPYVVRNGRTYVSRTVVVNNVTYTSVYRSYSYGGYCCYYGYQPAYYYAPAYYGWAYNPWPAPVSWGWGWGGAPWYGYYGYYFNPYPVYPSAAFWLTDYLISSELQAAYAAQQAAAANAAAAAANANAANSAPPDQQQGDAQPAAQNSGQVTLTPEVKEAIAEEVKAQLAAQQAQSQQQSSTGTQQPASGTQQAASAGAQPAAASGDVPPALDPARRTFIVDTDLTVNADGQECQLSSGDVLTRLTDTPDSDGNVNVSVQSSQKNDCAAGKLVAVSVNDLQEMHNHFEQQLDSGMKELASKQGTGGLPKAPTTSTVPSDVPPPAPDQNAAKTIDDQQAQADQTEAQVAKEAFNQGS